MRPLIVRLRTFNWVNVLAAVWIVLIPVLLCGHIAARQAAYERERIGRPTRPAAASEEPADRVPVVTLP